MDDIEGPITKAMLGSDRDRDRDRDRGGKAPLKSVVPFTAVTSRVGEMDSSVDSDDSLGGGDATALSASSSAVGVVDTTSQLLGSSGLTTGAGGNNRSQYSMASDAARLLGSTPDISSNSSSPGDVTGARGHGQRSNRAEDDDHVLMQGADEDDDLEVHKHQHQYNDDDDEGSTAGSINDDEYFAKNIITQLTSP